MVLRITTSKRYRRETNYFLHGLQTTDSAKYLGVTLGEDLACVQGSTNGTKGTPLSIKVLQMVPLVKLPMVPLGNPRTRRYIWRSTPKQQPPRPHVHLVSSGATSGSAANRSAQLHISPWSDQQWSMLPHLGIPKRQMSTALIHPSSRSTLCLQ